MLSGQAVLGLLVMGVSLGKLFWWGLPWLRLCETRLCRKMQHTAAATVASVGLGCCGSIPGALHDGAVAGQRTQTRRCPALHRSPRVWQVLLGLLWSAFDLLRALLTSPPLPAVALGAAAVAVQVGLLAAELSLFYVEYFKHAARASGERHQLLDPAVEMAQGKAL